MKVTYSAFARFSVVLLLLALPACGGGGDEVQSGGGGGAAGRGSGEAESAAVDSPENAPEGEVGMPEFDRKIIKTAELGIRAEDVRRSAAKAQQIVAQFDGSVQSSQINRGGEFVSADLVLLVPSPEFEKALDELRGLGRKVTTDAVRGEDVTGEFVDLKSRERNLLAAEQSLLKLYDEARSVNDTLAIQRELTNVRGQIEQVQGRIKYLENSTITSRITLSIQPVPGAAKSRPDWDPARVVAQAWGASLRVMQVLGTAVLSAVVFGWWLAPVLVAGFVWWKRRNRGSDPATSGPS